MDDLDLKVLRLTDYVSYTLPFMAQAAPTVFVDDIRSDDDESLNLVPRITTFAQLQSVFKLDVVRTLGYDATPEGGWYWAIIGFYIRTGIAAFIPKVVDENFNPPPSPGVLVYAHWPGAPQFPEPVNPNYHNTAVAGFTNENGDIGFGYSGSAVVGENGGVYDIWISADPPNGTRFYSDLATRLGWFGGTDHLTANPIFQATRKDGEQPPPTTGAKLVVFDVTGAFVGEVALVNGAGSGGRIALFSDDLEQAHVKLE